MREGPVTEKATARTDDPNAGMPAKAAWRTAFVRMAVVAGAFSVVVGAVTLVARLGVDTADPLNAPELNRLKRELLADPQDDRIKERIRALDLRLRAAFFRQQQLVTTGAHLLLVGLAACVLCLKAARKLSVSTPAPWNALVVEETRVSAAARTAVLGMTAALAVAALLVGFVWRPGARTEGGSAAPDGSPKAADGGTHVAKPEDVRGNWPYFRGPSGTGVAVSTRAPVEWDGKTGKGIAWSAQIPLRGSSSPIVWGDSVFLTGADKRRRAVYCYAAATGQLLWTVPVADVPDGGIVLTDVWDEDTYAAPTPVTDGRRVYALFANGDMVCLDYDGRPVWSRSVGPLDNSYGHASSLAMHKDTLIVLLDQKRTEDETDQSYLAGLDAATGKTRWETPRDVRDSWTTPLVMEVGGAPRVIAAGDPWTVAYDPANGEETWRIKALEGDVVPSPTYGAGLVFVAMEGTVLAAVRPDGTGEVTETHIVWTAEDDLPSIPTPVADDERIYVVSSEGMLTAYEARTGRKLWDSDLEAGFLASPVLVGDRVYLFSDKGKAFIVKAAPTYELVGSSELGEPVAGTPAFVGGRIYVRGRKHLFCIGEG
jgi:outer membrane protein assembly factor BamB